jgi:hypothetical protein
MNLAMLEQHLAEAEGHVALGEDHIARQRELIVKIEQQGHDSTEANRLLCSFEALQAIHRADRDRLRQEWSQRS